MDLQETLERYQESGNNAAFEALVEAYGSLVFGTALRSTANRVLAEEVAQEVFIILAKKAGQVRGAEALAAWLHRVTIHCAANANRKEHRRARAMKVYSEELAEELPGSKQEEERWSSIVPLLDRAINKLPSKDRSAVMLRFYERHSFKKIADLTGKSEEASRKQVSRALDKLAKLIGKWGVIAPSAVLAAGLSARLGRDAFPGAASQLAQQAIGASAPGGCSLLTQPLVVMSGFKSTLAVASLVALIPVGLQWRENEETARGAVKSDQPEAKSASGSRSSGRLAGRGGVSAARTEEELRVVLGEILSVRNPARRQAKSAHFMMSLRRDELSSALALLRSPLVTESRLTLNEEPGLWRALFSRWVALDPAAAVARLAETEVHELKQRALYGIVEGWNEIDFAATRAYLESLPPGNLRRTLLEFQWYRQAHDDPEAAVEAAMTLEDVYERMRRLQSIVEVYGREDPLAGIVWLENYEEGIDRQRWMTSLLKRLARSRPDEAFARAMRLTKSDHQRQVLPSIMARWAEIDPDRGLEALGALPSELRDGEVFQSFGQRFLTLDRVEEFARRLENGEERSALITGVTDGYRRDLRRFLALRPAQVERIRRLVEELPPGRFRGSAEWNFAVSWSSLDSGASVEWLQGSLEFSDSMKEKFARHYSR